ncbi:hypothetical protein DSM104443_00168 [Usitatibacter rugosus]|uniref:Uncharacterized protein n=1 Tax=Usitatibacter rugosus TaxID=2732067 RepID=A0A6M4GPL4_9PROT|nr:hypothetical protein [Usitatibacter rugosus]QJR09132.1 hypothetical protein DSM104443_00168 [Usitatibacter rugosus]
MNTPSRLLALSLVALAATGARADVFSDAYQCVKANAKLALVTAELGPGAVEFVVTKPQCVALVTSPAPVPATVMIGTLGLTATNVLPKKNPQCEGALYTTAAKPVAKILDKAGLLPDSVNKLISGNAADAAVGEAVQKIPGASIAFASFSCGCGLSNAGLNPDSVKEIYKATVAAGSKCSDVLGNVIEGGAKGIESAASAAGDVLSGQTKHVDPQVYYKAAFRPRLYRDYAAFKNQPQNLRPYIWNDEPVPQCIHYFDKHTMSPDNASKTCHALAEQYFAEYAQKQPQMEETRQMTDLRSFGPDTQSAGRYLLNSDTTPYGKYCATKFKKEPGYTVDNRARENFQLACMTTAGLYLGYTVKHYEYKHPNWTYTVNQNSPDRFQNRMAAAANNPGNRKAADIRKQAMDQLYAEFAPFADKAYPAWVSAVVKLEKETDAKGAKQEASNKEKEAKDKADKEAKEKAAGAKNLAEAQAACKDERCKADIVSYLANCKSRSGGTEGAQFKSDLNCKSNMGVLHDISARRAALDARLDGEVKKHVAILCPPDKDCSTGVHKQRSDIQAEEDKVWKYVSDSANERGNQDNAKALIYAEALKMLTPIEAKTIVAATVTKVNTVGREPIRIPGKKANDPPPPPPVVAYTPPPTPTTTAKPPTTYTIPPPVAKPPPPPPSTFPKNTPGSIGGNLAAGGSSIVAGCEPKSASELQALVCETEAALNKCRSLIVSGKVRSCAKSR